LKITNIIFYSLLVVVAIWFFASKFQPVEGLRELNDSEFATEIKSDKKQLVVDVREPSEVAAGYIAGAMNIPLGQLSNRLNEIPKDKEVLLYCRSGNRSKQAAQILFDHGYQNVSHLKGGILSWTGALKTP
jgi:rhodanese-related sulfurtransferase